MHELRVVGGVSGRQLDRLAVAARLATLEEVLRAGFAQRPAWDVREVIVQDEFTHDVVVDVAGDVFVVFDTT